MCSETMNTHDLKLWKRYLDKASPTAIHDLHKVVQGARRFSAGRGLRVATKNFANLKVLMAEGDCEYPPLVRYATIGRGDDAREDTRWLVPTADGADLSYWVRDLRRGYTAGA